MSNNLEASREAQKDYLFTKSLVTPVHDISTQEIEAGKDSSLVANLFVGDWAKKVSENGDAFVKFHGGEGFVPKETIGDERVLEIYFIDVEQGDSILIETPDDFRILIDGGRGENAHSFLDWKYNLKENYKQIDALIISHGDEDHADGLIPILNDKHIIVKSIYHNGIVARNSGKELGEYKKVNGKNMLYELVNDLTSSGEIPLEDLTNYYRSWVEAVINAKINTENEDLKFECIRVDHLSDPLELGENHKLKINFCKSDKLW